MTDLEILPRELRERLDAGEAPVLLDVRTPIEAEICQLEPSVLIPLHELVQRLDELDRDADIVVYCHHGMRSLQAAMYMQQQGFRTVRSLHGGINAWSLQIDPSVPRY